MCQGCWLINMILQARHGLWVILFDNFHKDCKKKPSSVICPIVGRSSNGICFNYGSKHYLPSYFILQIYSDMTIIWKHSGYINSLFLFFHLLFVLQIIQKAGFNWKFDTVLVITKQFKYLSYGNGILFDE